MLISEVMTTAVHVTTLNASLNHTLKLMDAEDSTVLPICEDGRLIGVISNRDITVRAAAKGLCLNETKVHEVMSIETGFVFEDQSTEYVSHLMIELQEQRLPVLNRENYLVGIVSFHDVS